MMETGQFLYSNTGKKIGFNDFTVSIEGAQVILKEEKYTKPGFSIKVDDAIVSLERDEKRLLYENEELELRSNCDLLSDPFIHIKVQMIKFPEVYCNLSIPVHFNGNYFLDFSGESGHSGVDGRKGRKYSKTSYHDLSANAFSVPGSDGTHGTHGSDGGNAENVKVYISLVDHPEADIQLVKIETIEYGKKAIIRYLEKTGSISINARGGYGGHGGNGGKGGDGQKGQDGLFVYNFFYG